MTTAPETASLRRAPRRRLPRAGRFEPALWIAPAVAVVLFVFGYSMVELVKTSLRYKSAWTVRELPGHVERPHLPHGAHPQRTPAARSPRARRAGAAHLGAAVRGAARLAIPSLGRVPSVRAADPGDRRHLRPDAAVQRARQPASTGVRARRSRADWLGQPRWALWTMTGVIIWKELGFGVVLFLARLFSCRPRRSRRGASTARDSSGCTASSRSPS